MKKNRMMRLASGLLVAVLLSTCTISGTFAKYVTEGSASDTARVAKWGIEMTVNGNDAFAEEYDGTVKTSVENQNLVAPGTASDPNNTVTFSLSGTPEVAFSLSASLNDKTDTNKVAEDVFLKAADEKYLDYTTANDPNDKFGLSQDYYPVVFTLTHIFGDEACSIKDVVPNEIYLDTGKNSENKNTETVTGTLAQINDVLTELSNKMTNLAPGYTFDDTFTLTWAWDFDDNGSGTNDKADTLLGNLAAGKVTGLTDGTDYNLELKYYFTITVTQVD